MKLLMNGASKGQTRIASKTRILRLALAMAWSGGLPYRVARFDPAKLHALLDRLEHEHQFSDNAV